MENELEARKYTQAELAEIDEKYIKPAITEASKVLFSYKSAFFTKLQAENSDGN